MFDKNYKLLDAAWEAVDPAANQVGVSPVIAHDYLMREYTAKEEGYVFMYVSNENATLVDVYFDDIIMTHTKSNVIQYNEYYPFGMQTANSWTRENNTGNNFLANSGTELNATSNLYDLDYRQYDPVLGRLNGIDPMATKYASLSPYNFSFNDPVTFSDLSGADPYTDGWETGRSYGTLGAMERILPNTSADDFIRTARNSPYGGMWGSSGGSFLFTSNEQAFVYGVAYNDYHDSWANTLWGSVSATIAYFEMEQSLLNPDYGSMCACLDGYSILSPSGYGNKHLKRDFKSLYVRQIESIVKNLRISKQGEPGYDPNIPFDPHFYPRQLAKEFERILRPKLIDKKGNTLILSRAYIAIGYIQLQSLKNPWGQPYPFQQVYNFEFDYIPYFDHNQKEIHNPGVGKSFGVKGSGGHVYWFDLYFKFQ